MILRPVLVASAVLVLLLVGEVLVRAAIRGEQARVLEEAMLGDRPMPIADEQGSLGAMIRPHPDDRVVYTLRPGVRDMIFKTAPVSTNSHGFRSEEEPVAEPPGAVTIVTLGNSVMFGHGLADGLSYPDALRRLLRERRPDVPWRVVNASLPGANTMMEVARLERDLLAWSPDLVLLGITNNDFRPPLYVRVEEDLDALDRSFLLDEASRRLAGDGADDPRLAFRREALTNRKRWADLEPGGRQAPARYDGLHGRPAALRALEGLRRLSEREGFEVVAVLVFEPTPDAPGRRAPELVLADACRRLGFPVLRMQPEIEREVEAQAEGRPFSWDLFSASDLAVSPTNGHPSARLGELTARSLLALLEQEGVLDRLRRAPW